MTELKWRVGYGSADCLEIEEYDEVDDVWYPFAYMDLEEHGAEPTVHQKIAASLMCCAPEFLEALKEIAKGEGAFSLDRLTHANNTVENMKEIAQNAIARAEGIKDD